MTKSQWRNDFTPRFFQKHHLTDCDGRRIWSAIGNSTLPTLIRFAVSPRSSGSSADAFCVGPAAVFCVCRNYLASQVLS